MKVFIYVFLLIYFTSLIEGRKKYKRSNEEYKNTTNEQNRDTNNSDNHKKSDIKDSAIDEGNIYVRQKEKNPKNENNQDLNLESKTDIKQAINPNSKSQSTEEATNPNVRLTEKEDVIRETKDIVIIIDVITADNSQDNSKRTDNTEMTNANLHLEKLTEIQHSDQLKESVEELETIPSENQNLEYVIEPDLNDFTEEQLVEDSEFLPNQDIFDEYLYDEYSDISIKSTGTKHRPETRNKQPNIIFILADDMVSKKKILQQTHF